jgi:hypothetical protein
MPIVAIKKNPMADGTNAPLYVNIVGARGSVGSVVTATLNPREYPRDILVDSGRDIRLARGSTKLTFKGIDLAPLFEYRDTVRYVTDGEMGDETVTAYRVRIIPEPGLYSLTRKGLTRLPTP